MGFVSRRNSGKHSLTKKKCCPCPICLHSAALPDLTNRPCVVTPGLELHSPCVRLRTIHKTNRPCDPAHFSHTLARRFIELDVSSLPVIDIPPDAVDKDALLTRLRVVFDNGSAIVNETLEISF